MIKHPQQKVCEKYGVPYCPAEPSSKLGVADNVTQALLPINGLRHPETHLTNGWYIWAGETFSTEPDFFKPLHIEHIQEWCPLAERFLALPPGYRFLVSLDYEDVWFDRSLLDIV